MKSSLSIVGLPNDIASRIEPSPLRSYFLNPTRIVWKSPSGIANAENLLVENRGQSVLAKQSKCILSLGESGLGGLVLDFGVEIQGCLEIFTPITESKEPRSIRVRFGESVSETMSEMGTQQNAQNDHAARDQVLLLPWFGKKIVGPSGFRFVRIDAENPNIPVEISEVRAVLILRDIPALGSFKCSDERLTRIWNVGAYTVHLNMQEYLWDGIKRDRLVWIGDMHPEVSTINAVFGFNEVVPKSLDLTSSVYLPTEWMNTISSYSLWWIILQRDWWLHHGDLPYLEKQHAYLSQLLTHLSLFIDVDGSEKLEGMRFIDWPTATNMSAIHEGLQSLMILAMDAGAQLCHALNDFPKESQCRKNVELLRQHNPGSGASKQSVALMVLSGLMSGEEALPLLKSEGARHISTFFGYYVIQALAQLGESETAMDFISQFWGGMLDRGATTFWEDFNLDWLENSGRIDELTPDGMRDLHGDFGDHCYVGFRHSLCHGWASGPTAWLSRHVLGIEPVGGGFCRVQIKPNLGKLRWAEGTYPTPYGPISVRHERLPDGEVKSECSVPPQITIV